MFNRDEKWRRYVKVNWPSSIDKERDYVGIKKYYQDFTKSKYGEVDDQTFSDLSMKEVFDKLDRTYSSAGEAKLYNMLRDPIYDKAKLESISNQIKSFSENVEERIDIQKEFLKLGKDRNFSFIDFLSQDWQGNKKKRVLYIFLGKILPLICIALCFIRPQLIVLFVGIVFMNSYISNKESGVNNTKPYEAIQYVGRMMKTSRYLLSRNYKVIEPYNKRLEKVMNVLKVDERKFKWVTSTLSGSFYNIELIEPFIDVIGQCTLGLENSYYGLIENTNKYKKELKELYDILGDIDALISVAAYKEDTEYEISTPEFIDEDTFKIIDGAHPLIEDVVTNSIEIDNKGIVLTGTNMSGKSTFLRMLGINIVLAQSFNFVHAKEYKAPFLNIISSISPEDDVTKGKSYYLAEAESILRIINNLDKELKVFCVIDEIFRGTNPVERIAASEEILKYIQQRNSVSLVATHDRELTELLESTHKFYHFSEEVDEKEGLSFDYKLKKGVLKTKNAIKLLKYVGYPSDIIEGAYKNIEQNDNKII